LHTEITHGQDQKLQKICRAGAVMLDSLADSGWIAKRKEKGKGFAIRVTNCAEIGKKP